MRNELRKDWITNWTDIGEQEENLGHVDGDRCRYLSKRLAEIYGPEDGDTLMSCYLNGVQIARGNPSSIDADDRRTGGAE